MNQEPGVRLEDLLGALQRRGIPLPFEIGTFVALETCEQIARAPVRVGPADVRLDEEGRVAVLAEGAASDEEACRALVVLLGDLLVRSAPGVPPMLLQLVEVGPGTGEWSLARLRDDLEAALVPLNRSATRRVLARLLREAQRDDDRPSKRISSPPSERDIDAALEDVLGSGRGDAPEATSNEIARPSVAPAHASTASRRADLRAEMDLEDAAGPPPGRDGGRSGGLAEFERVASSRGGGGAAIAVGVVLLAFALLGAYALWSR